MKDVSIVAAVVVVCIILVVVASVALLVRFLRGVVDGGSRPTFECAAWLAARQQGYLHGSPPPADPATGSPWTICDAAKQAVHDSQQPASASGCPAREAPLGAERRSPYDVYMAAQGCSSA